MFIGVAIQRKNTLKNQHMHSCFYHLSIGNQCYDVFVSIEYRKKHEIYLWSTVSPLWVSNIIFCERQTKIKFSLMRRQNTPLLFQLDWLITQRMKKILVVSGQKNRPCSHFISWQLSWIDTDDAKTKCHHCWELISALHIKLMLLWLPRVFPYQHMEG